MSRFLRNSLKEDKTRFGNYANRESSTCDLSLISGPFIWEEQVRQAWAILEDKHICHYPLPNQNPELLETLAEFEGVSADSIWLTPGADVAIEAVLTRFLDAGDEFAILIPNFPRFAIVAETIPDITINRIDDLSKLNRGTKLVAVCTPNNPTTEELLEKDLRQAISEHQDTLFCIDGVFDWYGSYSLSNICRDFDNVILLKSFSKIGLAGLRLGYVVSSPGLINAAQTGLSPFSVPSIIQGIGLQVARSFHRITEISEILDVEFNMIKNSLGDCVIRRSPLPFYLVQPAINASEAADLLREEGISVLDGSHCPDLPGGCLRVAIGNSHNNKFLVEAIDRLGVVD